MRESITRQVDKKSRVSEEEKRVWGSQGGDRGVEFSRRRKGQTSFLSTFFSLNHIKLFSLSPGETEENHRMGKTRDLFKEITDAKGTYHAKMLSIKVRNIMDLTETEDIKKWWQKYTELYKKRASRPR